MTNKLFFILREKYHFPIISICIFLYSTCINTSSGELVFGGSIEPRERNKLEVDEFL